MREKFVIALTNRYDALYNGSHDEEQAELDQRHVLIHLGGSTWKGQERKEGMDE